MRKIIVYMQSTLNGCIANTQGTFWQPFPWGDAEHDAEHAALQDLKGQPGDADILLTCGPNTLGPLISAPGLVDEYAIAIHPAVLAAGPQLFGHLSHDLALELVDVTAFDGGVVVLRHRVMQPSA